MPIHGNYSVTIRQEVRGKAVTFTARGSFQENETDINGAFEYSPAGTGANLTSALAKLDQYRIKCEGFRRGDLVQLRFDNTMVDVDHFGACMMSVQEGGVWSGQWVGYSPENQGIITGDISMIPLP